MDVLERDAGARAAVDRNDAPAREAEPHEAPERRSAAHRRRKRGLELAVVLPARREHLHHTLHSAAHLGQATACEHGCTIGNSALFCHSVGCFGEKNVSVPAGAWTEVASSRCTSSGPFPRGKRASITIHCQTLRWSTGAATTAARAGHDPSCPRLPAQLRCSVLRVAWVAAFMGRMHRTAGAAHHLADAPDVVVGGADEEDAAGGGGGGGLLLRLWVFATLQTQPPH